MAEVRLTQMVACAGCAAKLRPGQLREVLSRLPAEVDPNVLVGFETSDDAGLYRLPSGEVLVQTVDFFPPIVDDPYAFGAIAAANAISDVYAMGGRPLTALNIACFDPEAAPPEVWAAILLGARDKTAEAGAVVLGGHSVEDPQPKFGVAVTGLVDPDRAFVNTAARSEDRIWLTKPLGTGVITTGAKFGLATDAELEGAIAVMSRLNREACEAGLAAGVRCATDVTGFGLAGHLFNVARGSGVSLELDSAAWPVLPGVERLIALDAVAGGAGRNREYLGEHLVFAQEVPDWRRVLAVDPQTSGGLALFSAEPVPGAVCIGRVAGPWLGDGPAIRVV